MGINNYQVEAEKLLRKLEKERKGRTLSLGKTVKTLPAKKQIMESDPGVQAAIVESVVETFAKLGDEGAPNAHYWWGNSKLPWGSAEIAEDLLKRDLPISDKQLEGMFQKLTKIGLLTSAVVPCVEQLVRQAEKRAAKRELPESLKKKMARFGAALSGKKLSTKAARLWKQEEHTPVALDRKIAGRIQRLTQGPATL